MRCTCHMPSFSFFPYCSFRDTEVQSFSVFPTWLPHHVTYDVMVVIATFYMSSNTNRENFVSIRQEKKKINLKPPLIHPKPTSFKFPVFLPESPCDVQLVYPEYPTHPILLPYTDLLMSLFPHCLFFSSPTRLVSSSPCCTLCVFALIRALTVYTKKQTNWNYINIISDHAHP